MGLWVAIAIAPLSACAGILGIEDGHLRGGGDGGSDATTSADGAIVTEGDGGTEDAGDDTADSAPPIPDGGSCDPAAKLDPSGVFVAVGGDGSTGATCTQAAPCATIQQGIDVAHNKGSATSVYVRGGVYREQITLRSNVSVIGGWSASWAHDCSATTVKAPAGFIPTVIASGGITATLSSLIVESENGGDVASGATMVGIQATGSGTVLNLGYVIVTVTNGGDGPAGGEGDAGTTPATCSGAGDAGSSTVAGLKGGGADAGWFMSSGFVATAGGPGGPGGSGNNGGAGGAGACVHCIATCTGSVLSCASTDGGFECGSQGTSGCGGTGGYGGVGGATGGSSVALFVSDATVHLLGCTLSAGNGGNGGAGGLGGTPGKGGAGAAGAPSAQGCDTVCNAGLLGTSCGTSTTEYGPGGDAGTAGGSGAAGGVGGDGAGGDSYAIVEVGGATVIDSPDAGLSQRLPGLPGSTPDGGNGAPGQSGNTLQQ